MKTIIVVIMGLHLSVGWNSCLSQTNQMAAHEDYVAHAKADAKAQVDRRGKHLMSVCDKRVAQYDGFNQIQEAFATLTLSGIHEVLIRPKGQLGPASLPTSYDLLVPHDSAIRAAAALRSANVCELKRFDESFNAVPVMSVLRAHGIEATIRPLKKDERETASRVTVVYVRRSNEQAAKALLASR